jgi:hypothetical protein
MIILCDSTDLIPHYVNVSLVDNTKFHNFLEIFHGNENKVVIVMRTVTVYTAIIHISPVLNLKPDCYVNTLH